MLHSFPMQLHKLVKYVPYRNLSTCVIRKQTFTATDAVEEKPVQSRVFSYLFVSGAIIAGMSAGAWMSKNIASFLEENELFVPSDDDDDF